MLNAEVKILCWPTDGPAEVVACADGDDPEGASSHVYLMFDELV